MIFPPQIIYHFYKSKIDVYSIVPKINISFYILIDEAAFFNKKLKKTMLISRIS